jgi:heme exporter protein B
MLALYIRDVRLGIRAGGGALTGIIFFLAVVSVVPFGVGPDLNLLARIGPAMLWIAALLSVLLGLDRLFQADREDGSLDLLLIAGERHMIALTVFVKCLAHWTASVLPLVIAAPLLGLLMNMEPAAIGAAWLTLMVGTPAIIFGVSASYGAVTDPAPFLPPFLILCALTLFFAVIGPLGAALALKWSSD